MVSIRSSHQGRLRPVPSSAPPPCFAEAPYRRLRDRVAELEQRAEEVDRGLASAAMPAEVLAAAEPPGERDSPRRRDPGQSVDPSLAAFVDALLDTTTDRFRILAAAGLAEAGGLHRFEDTHLAPAARLLGEYWLSDECDFLTVTIAVARLERLFMALAMEPRAAAAPDGARRILLAPAPGNQHSFGLALVEERFCSAGWSVDCCGVGDGSDMLRLVAASCYDVIGLSVHSGALLPDLAAMVGRLRRTSRNRTAVILGGGSLAIENGRLLLDAGFDRLAEDAASAVRQAEAAVASRGDPPYRAAAE